MDLERGLLRHIGLASSAVGVLLYAALPVQAADGNMLSPFTNFITAPFSGGKKAPAADDGGSAIDYRPRPALVVPPNNDLPPPHPSVVRSADWPKDPDSLMLRKARADSRQLAPASDSKLDSGDMDSPGDDSPPPPPVQAAAGPPPNCTTIGGMPICVATPWGKVTLPGGGKSAATNPGDVRLSATPTRKYLTDPPVTYLAPVQVSESDRAQAKAIAKTQPKCLIPTPGWFGCPAADQ